MANRKTFWTNAWESTAPSGLSDVSLTLTVADGSALPTNDFYVVIEPDNPAQREFMFVESRIGNTLTIASGERYLQGSAAGSGLTHPSNSVVRSAAVAQGFTDLHDRIDAAETTIAANDPAGAYLPLSGGALTGSLALGTNRITGVGDPVGAQDAATRNWVETTVGADLTSHEGAADPHALYLLESAAATTYLPLSGGTVTGALNVNGDPTTGEGVGNRDYNDARYVAVGGTAALANALATARTISLTGDVTGSVGFDGSANVSIAAVVGNDSHSHGDSTIDGLNASAITAGTLAFARLPTGTTSSTVAVGNHSHSNYLTTSGKAADSNLLDGLDSTAFLRSNTVDTFTGDELVFNDVTNTQVIRISSTQGKNHIVWNNNPYTNGTGDYQAYWDNDILGTNVGWAITTTLSSSEAIKQNIRPYDVDTVGAGLLRIPLRSWEYNPTALAIAGFPSHLDGHMPKDGDGPTRHWFVAEEVEAELPWLVGTPEGDGVKRIRDGRPLQMAMLAALQYLAKRVDALENA